MREFYFIHKNMASHFKQDKKGVSVYIILNEIKKIVFAAILISK